MSPLGPVGFLGRGLGFGLGALGSLGSESSSSSFAFGALVAFFADVFFGGALAFAAAAGFLAGLGLAALGHSSSSSWVKSTKSSSLSLSDMFCGRDMLSECCSFAAERCYPLWMLRGGSCSRARAPAAAIPELCRQSCFGPKLRVKIAQRCNWAVRSSPCVRSRYRR